MLLGAAILFLYPLRGKYLEQIQSQILELHAQKHARYQDQQAEVLQVGEAGPAQSIP